MRKALDPTAPQALHPVAPQIKAWRQHLGLSQTACAQTVAQAVGTLRAGEQGRVLPDRAARTLLEVMAHNPEAVKMALQARSARR